MKKEFKVGDLVRLNINFSRGAVFYKAGDLGMICPPPVKDVPPSHLSVYILHQRTGVKNFVGEMYLEKVS